MSREVKIAVGVAALLVAWLIVSPWLVGDYVYHGPPTPVPAPLPYWVEHYGDPDAGAPRKDAS